MVRLARRLTGSTLLGCVAGLLLCFDGLQFVLSRLALLDIFVAFFLLCAVACLVADRDWGRARLARLVPTGYRTSAADWGPVRALLLAAVAARRRGVVRPGARHQVERDLPAGGASGILVWMWDAGARRAIGVRWPRLRSLVADALPAFGYLVLVALVVYVATLDRLAAARGRLREGALGHAVRPLLGQLPQARRARVLPRAVAVAALAVALPPRRLRLPHASSSTTRRTPTSPSRRAG